MNNQLSTPEQKQQAFGRLLTIMDELRAQCPWDKKQTMESLRHLTIEEMYELADAILTGNMQPAKVSALCWLVFRLVCRQL